MAETQPSILITAGPTHEPIDAVRYLANRSSGRMGLAIAAAAARSHRTTLLLGPTCFDPQESTQLTVMRFRTTAELQALLAEHWPQHDVLIMAAAVADYRPKPSPGMPSEAKKIRRTANGLTLELESTPDLLAQCSETRRAGQRLIGFALEPADHLRTSAEAKLSRKGVDAIVANPIETMDAEQVDAYVLLRSGQTLSPGGPLPKNDFATWLISIIPKITSPAPL